MGTAETLIFYHAPMTRSFAVRVLLEELGAEHRLQPLNLRAGESRTPAYLGINPMGKVPAIVHEGALVTELGAIFIYLADCFPTAGLAPVIGDKLRGPYLRWLVFYGSTFEPAVLDRAMQRDAGDAGRSPYGDFDTMMATVTAQLGRGPYLLGDRFSATDVLWGSALDWTTESKMVPEHADVASYVARVRARPAMARVRKLDAALAAEQAAAAQAPAPG